MDDESNKAKKDTSKEESNRTNLLGIKITYFFLFGSFGAIWPYLALYFRQNGLNSSYVGIIAGIRPMIQFISCPFWSIIADKYQASKIILNISMISLFFMTILLFLPKPSIIHCPESIANNLSAATYFDSPEFHNKSVVHIEEVGGKKHFISKIKTFLLNSPEISHVSDSHHLSVYSDADTLKNITEHSIAIRSLSGTLLHEHSKFPLFLYENKDVIRIFWIILALTVVGEFFEAPSVSLLDTAILQSLENINCYGRIRLYGSLGFGLSSFIVGFTLDHVRKTICGKVVTDFMVLAYFFSGWIICAILFCWFTVHFPRSEKLIGDNNAFWETMYVFQKPKYLIFLVVSFYMGFSHGSIMNFINWYLEDLGANRLMMGTATILRDLAVVLGFYISPTILENFSNNNILIWAFAVYTFSYFSYSLLLTPWMAVPVEALQGLAFAIMWSSSINYLARVSSPSNFATMQGVIQGIYWGLGTGTGAIVGGICISYYGSQLSFRYGGYATLIAGIIFIITNNIAEKLENKDEKHPT